jgi:excisionase family DNA binding protein
MDKLLLKIDDAAEALSLGRSRTYKLIQSGVLPVIRIGRSIRIPAQALALWIETQTESRPIL